MSIEVQNFVENALEENKEIFSSLFHIEFSPDFGSIEPQITSENKSTIHLHGLYKLKTSLKGLSFDLYLSGLMVFGAKHEKNKGQEIFIMGGEFTDDYAIIETNTLEFEASEETIANTLKEHLNIEDFAIMLQKGLDQNTIDNVIEAFDRHASLKQMF